jgi:hypothetical protein
MNMKKILTVLLLSIILTSTVLAQVPNRIIREIKTIAKLDWPGDYEMQRYNIDKQIKAYEQVSNLRKRGFRGVPFATVRSIVEKSQLDWPQDYEMQRYSATKQIKSYLAIN